MFPSSSLDPQTAIAFIGGSDIAAALVSGLIKQGHCRHHLLLTDLRRGVRNRLGEQYFIKTDADIGVAVQFANIVIVAVDAEQADQVCLDLNDEMQAQQRDPLVISLVAGVDMQQLRETLCCCSRIVCATPNLPSSICIGLTGLYADRTLANADANLADSVMRAVGETVWLGTESLIPSLIATAGSSPAYFYLFMEAMEKAAIAQGLDPEVAKTSILQSALGAVSMAIRSDQSLSALRKQITTPKDYTDEAVKSMQSEDIDRIVANAMNSAAQRVNEIYRK